MGYLIWQMWMLLTLAALIGIGLGWWLRGPEAESGDAKKDKDLHADLMNARKEIGMLQAANGELKKSNYPDRSAEIEKLKVRIAELEGQLAAAKAAASRSAPIPKAPAPNNVVPIATAKPAPEVKAAVKPAVKVAVESKAAKPAAKVAAKSALVKAPAAAPVAAQPKGLKGPRQGKADDLKKINGVGPKIEKQLNDLGLYHFDQLASLNKAEIDWVEDHIGFPGRISRENWVKQCAALGGKPAKK